MGRVECGEGDGVGDYQLRRQGASHHRGMWACRTNVMRSQRSWSPLDRAGGRALQREACMSVRRKRLRSHSGRIGPVPPRLGRVVCLKWRPGGAFGVLKKVSPASARADSESGLALSVAEVCVSKVTALLLKSPRPFGVPTPEGLL